jgi:hypothetical protein
MEHKRLKGRALRDLCAKVAPLDDTCDAVLAHEVAQ